MTRSEKQSWEQMRTQGRSRFVLREGLLRFGLPFGAFLTIGCLAIDWFGRSPIEPVWKLAARFGFFTLASGLFSGIKTWNERERDFQKQTDDDGVV